MFTLHHFIYLYFNFIFIAATVEALGALHVALEMRKIGKLEKALKLFEHAMALSPKHPDVLNHYGEFLEETHNDIIQADQMYFRVGK